MKQHHFYIFDSINKKQLYPFFLVSFALATTPNSTFAADTQNTQWSIAPYDKAVAAFNEQKQLEIEKQDPINNYGVDDYVVIADTVDFSDNSMALGNIFGSKLEIGAHSKIYGNAKASDECSLRTKAHVTGTLQYTTPCNEQPGVIVTSQKKTKITKPSAVLPSFAFNESTKPISISKSEVLPPGEYGNFTAKSKAKVKFSSGSYSFRSFKTEPGVQLTFDMESGPISISVVSDVHFGNRNSIKINEGNPSEITWNIAGKTVDLGTDGTYFGTIVAPNAFVNIQSRSHLVGSVYANKLSVAPKSTISREPRVEEISHSEEHFGPFFEPKNYRYQSVLPPTAQSVEMFVYAKDSKVKINGKESAKVELSTATTAVNITVFRNKIAGFPAEAFSSNYVFNFERNDNYRIYWNPQSPCSQGCDGTTTATAIGDFAAVLETAQKTGREINMLRGTWRVSENFADSVVPWKVGFELVGYTGDIWQLKSENDLPLIDLGKTHHIEIEGRSPRSLTGFRIVNGFNQTNGGAISARNQKLTIKNSIISDSKSNAEGGALYATDSLNFEKDRFSDNEAKGEGGAVAANGETRMLSVVYTANRSAKKGGAIKFGGKGAYIGNAVFHNNQAVSGGAINNDASKLDIWNSTFYANIAKATNPAVSGKANGTIGNSIFWKNYTPSCEPGKCANEITDGFTATHSSFSRPYGGSHIRSGDPKFMDEKNPAGSNKFMGYDAGINLAYDSPLRKAGKLDMQMPKADVMGSERDKKELALGAYGILNMVATDFFIGELGEDNKVVPADPMIPLMDTIPTDWFRSFLAYSKLARVLKVKVMKHPMTKVDSAKVQFTLIKKDKTPYGFKPVDIMFYRNGEEDGKYVFQTMTDSLGKAVLFTRNEEDIGNFEDAVILCIKDGSDRFNYKILEY